MGERGLFLAPEPDALPEGDACFATFGFTPLGKLLPRSRAIVHHGGIGTTARALRDGLPQIVVPHSHDQPDNAVRVKALGAGDFVPSAHLNVDRLVAALARELERPASERAGRGDGSIPGPDAAARVITRRDRAPRA